MGIEIRQGIHTDTADRFGERPAVGSQIDGEEVRGRPRLTDGMTEAARRDKDQIPVGKLTGGDIVEGAVGQLGQPGTVDADAPQMPVLLVELAVREEDRLGVVGKIDIVDRAFGIGERDRCRLFWMGRVDDPNLRPRGGRL